MHFLSLVTCVCEVYKLIPIKGILFGRRFYMYSPFVETDDSDLKWNTVKQKIKKSNARNGARDMQLMDFMTPKTTENKKQKMSPDQYKREYIKLMHKIWIHNTSAEMRANITPEYLESIIGQFIDNYENFMVLYENASSITNSKNPLNLPDNLFAAEKKKIVAWVKRQKQYLQKKLEQLENEELSMPWNVVGTNNVRAVQNTYTPRKAIQRTQEVPQNPQQESNRDMLIRMSYSPDDVDLFLRNHSHLVKEKDKDFVLVKMSDFKHDVIDKKPVSMGQKTWKQPEKMKFQDQLQELGISIDTIQQFYKSNPQMKYETLRTVAEKIFEFEEDSKSRETGVGVNTVGPELHGDMQYAGAYAAPACHALTYAAPVAYAGPHAMTYAAPVAYADPHGMTYAAMEYDPAHAMTYAAPEQYGDAGCFHAVQSCRAIAQTRADPARRRSFRVFAACRED